MLYLDSILVYEHMRADTCFSKYDLAGNPSKESEDCLKRLNSLEDFYYGKYFGIYRLVQYSNISTGKWKPE